MAAAKDSIENNAGDHHTQENQNDALQRHGVLLLPAYAPGAFALLPVPNGEATTTPNSSERNVKSANRGAGSTDSRRCRSFSPDCRSSHSEHVLKKQPARDRRTSTEVKLIGPPMWAFLVGARRGKWFMTQSSFASRFPLLPVTPEVAGSSPVVPRHSLLFLFYTLYFFEASAR
jgi:hypothetical protein